MQRVTLDDFRTLQAELLKARQALHESETKLKCQALEIEKHRAVAALFPSAAPRPHVAGRPAASANPFGSLPPQDVGVQTDESGGAPLALPDIPRTPTKKEDGDADLTGASCSLRTAAPTCVTPETHAAENGRPSHPLRTPSCARIGVCLSLLQRQQERGLVRLVFHGWCAAHSNTQILHNMSGIAAMIRHKQPVSQDVVVTPVAAPTPADKAMRARIARLEEELAASDMERENAVATAVEAVKKQYEGTHGSRGTGATAQLERKVSALEAELARYKDGMMMERRRNASVLQELARSLTATHSRAMVELKKQQCSSDGEHTQDAVRPQHTVAT
ncbi:hypothetical protein AB1Y20_017720 [Prymnesium parvum]|uniref:Centrosomal protein of 162 kDa n=1 Tax=Prymnesium parvum TaxID=97485 RepID=A0AB34JND2_PRYPA